MGRLVSFDLLKASGAIMVYQSLSDMEPAKFSLLEADLTAKVTDDKTYLHFLFTSKRTIIRFC